MEKARDLAGGRKMRREEKKNEGKIGEEQKRDMLLAL